MKVIKGTGAAGSVATHVVVDSGSSSVSNFPSSYHVNNGDNVALGTTTDAAVVTDAAGTLQQYARGQVKLWTQYTWAFDYDASNNPIYMGRAVAGTAKTAASWQIRKVIYDVNSNPTDMQYANGSLNYDQVWNSRAGLAYS